MVDHTAWHGSQHRQEEYGRGGSVRDGGGLDARDAAPGASEETAQGKVNDNDRAKKKTRRGARKRKTTGAEEVAAACTEGGTSDDSEC